MAAAMASGSSLYLLMLNASCTRKRMMFTGFARIAELR